jgi:amidase
MYDQALVEAATTTGPLAGVPYLLTALATETAGVRFIEGSRFPRGYTSSYDSELVRRLRRAGLVIVGKTNTPEFGWFQPASPYCLVKPVIPGMRSGRPADLAVAQPRPWRPAWCRARMQTTSVARSASRRRPADSLVSSRRARNSFGPEYGDVVSGWAAEHALARSGRMRANLASFLVAPRLRLA